MASVPPSEPERIEPQEPPGVDPVPVEPQPVEPPEEPQPQPDEPGRAPEEYPMPGEGLLAFPDMPLWLVELERSAP
jgi:hypothetical protein